MLPVARFSPSNLMQNLESITEEKPNKLVELFSANDMEERLYEIYDEANDYIEEISPQLRSKILPQIMEAPQEIQIKIFTNLDTASLLVESFADCYPENYDEKIYFWINQYLNNVELNRYKILGISFLLDSLNDDCLIDIANYIVNHPDKTYFSDLLYFIRDDRVSDAFVSALTGGDTVQAKTRVRELINELVQKIQSFQAEYPKVFVSLVNWYIDTANNEFSNRKKVLNIQKLIAKLNLKQLIVFIFAINKSNKFIIPYILIACDEDVFYQAMNDETFKDFEDRSYMFDQCTIDYPFDLNCIAKYLNEKERLEILIKNSLLRITEKVGSYIDGERVIAEEISQQSFYNLCTEISLNINSLDPSMQDSCMTIYTSQLQSIPPIIAALGMYNVDTRVYILKFLPYWSEDQICAIAKALQCDDLISILETPGRLQNNQVKDIITNVYDEVLKDYCIYERRQISQTLQEANSLASEIDKEVHFLIQRRERNPNEKHISVHDYQEIITKSLKPQLMLKQYVSQSKITLQKHLRDLLKIDQIGREEFINYLDSISSLETEIKTLCDSSYHEKINELEKFLIDDDKTDPLENFPEPFVFEMTQQKWALAGFDTKENPYKILNDHGVQSTKDLIALNYNQKDEQISKRIMLRILDFMKRDLGVFSLIPDEKWEKLFYESEDFKDDCVKFSQDKCFIESKTKDLKILAEFLLSQMIESQSLTPVEIKLLENYKDKIHQKRNEEAINGVCRKCVEISMRFYRLKAPIFSIKKYFKQPNLKEVWEKLHSEGIYSLSSLIEKDRITKITDIYKLGKTLK